MMIIDTHTHLYSDQFDQDREEMIQRALDNNVQKMLLPNIDMYTLDGMMDLVEKFPNNCYPMFGLHPGNVGADWQEQLECIHASFLKNQDKAVAIGEIGMDLYWDKTFEEEQKLAFRQQIDWAKKYDLPIVIHARDAWEEIFEILDDVNDETLKGVFHCFTGTFVQAQKVMAYGGFKMGIGGVVTYKKSELPVVIAQIPLEYIMLETDSPYLPPVPYRGKRNESAYVIHVLEKLVDIYGKSYQELAEITTQNAYNLFTHLK